MFATLIYACGLSLSRSIACVEESMEGQPSSPALASMASEQRVEVDTSRPFGSVKEAVAVFGERFLAGNAYSQKNNSLRPFNSVPKQVGCSASSSPPSYSSSASHFIQERDDEPIILTSLKKLEAELKETKRELLQLKQRESETAIAVATLNTQLNESMCKLSEMEAANAVESTVGTEDQPSRVRSERWQEERMRDLERSLEYLPTLAQAFSLGEWEDDFVGRRKMKMPKKKKPIIPLIGDMFSKKKRSTYVNNSLYSRSSFYSDLS